MSVIDPDDLDARRRAARETKREAKPPLDAKAELARLRATPEQSVNECGSAEREPQPAPGHHFHRLGGVDALFADGTCGLCPPAQRAQEPEPQPSYRATLFGSMDREYAEKLIGFLGNMLSELDRQFRPPEEPYTGLALRARQWVEYVLHDGWLEIDRARKTEEG